MASEALQDVQHLKQTISENKRNREWFEKELKKLHIKCLPSASNFIFIECNQNSNMAEDIYNILLKNGIIVRQLNSYGLPNWLRITIGSREEIEKTIEVLATNKLPS